MKRPPEQLLFLGDNAECAKWLPLVRRKALSIRQRHNGRGVLTEKVRLPGGWALIKVSRARSKLVIYCEPGGVTYEFFTSEALVYQTGSSAAGTPAVDGNACGRGSYHQLVGGAMKSTPLVDFCSDCPPPPDPNNPPPWPSRPCNRDVGGEGRMKTREFWSRLMDWRQIWYSGGAGKEFVVTPGARIHGYSGTAETSRVNSELFRKNHIGFNHDGGGVEVYTAGGFEPAHIGIPDELFGVNAESLIGAAALYTAESGRRFVLAADYRGNVYVWRLKSYLSSVITEYTKVQLPHPLWADTNLGVVAFNSTATRAVSTPHREWDAPLTANGDVPYKAFDPTNGLPIVTGRFPPDAHFPIEPAIERTPGIVEFAIFIDDDVELDTYSVSINRTFDETFETSGRYVISADYLFGDSRLPHPKDTLVSLTAEVRREAGDYLWEVSLPEVAQSPDHILTRVNVTHVIGARIGNAWSTLARIPTLGKARMRFFTEPSYIRYVPGVPDQLFYTDAILIEQEVGVPASVDHLHTIFAIDLRCLSWATYGVIPNASTDGYETGITVTAYGEVVHTDFDSGYTPPVEQHDGYVTCEADLRELWAAAVHEARFPNYWMEFCVHPRGHWSIESQALQFGEEYEIGSTIKQVDIVNVRQNGVDRRFTHRELYNAAFGDSRDYPYYVTDEPGGTFRTFGLFRDG